MKQLFLSLLGILLLTLATYAQTTQGINYQGLARDNSGTPLANQLISIQFSILQGSATGTAVYVETQQQTTDGFGMFALQIGNGAVQTGNFASLNWGNETYFLKVEFDPAGGTNYSLAGITQFGSVPSSLHAANGLPPGQTPGSMLYWDGSHWLIIPPGSNGQVLRFTNSSPVWTSTTTIPSVITTPPIINADFSVTTGGNVSDGGSPVLVRGICWSLSPNPTLADPNITNGNGAGVFTSTITGLVSATNYHVRAYATNSIGISYGNDISFNSSSANVFACGSPITKHHEPGTVAPVDKTVTYGTVTNVPGELTKCWITSNLGADNQATSVSDVTETSAGWYWQFNRKQGYKSDGITVTPAWTITSISENSDWLVDNDPCTIELGLGWRIPTLSEWTNVTTEGGWNNWNGPWNSYLKLHAAGYMQSDGVLVGRGYSGAYWHNKQGGDGFGGVFWIGYNFATYNYYLPKEYGMSVRCINGVSDGTSSLPTVTTTSISNIAETTATGGGEVTAEGASSVTARGICWGTAADPTITDNHTTDGAGAGTFTSNFTSLSANTLYHVRAYATNRDGTAYGSDVSFTTLSTGGGGSFTCGSILHIDHTPGEVAPVTKTVDYVTVTNITGEPTKCWITSNLGADHQATSFDDATEASAGWYWQFNRKQGYKHDGTTRTPNTTWITSINENSDWLPANDPCTVLGAGWRLPTNAEWDNVDTIGMWHNMDGPWNSPLKLHAAGRILTSDVGYLNSRGQIGDYWSSVQSVANYGYNYGCATNSSQLYTDNKDFGLSIRCLKELSGSSMSIPTVITGEISDIAQTTATASGNVTNDGGNSSFTTKGICWSTSANPSITDSHTNDGSGAGLFTSYLDSLTPNTVYHVRAYASNSVGTGYGDDVTFTTLP